MEDCGQTPRIDKPGQIESQITSTNNSIDRLADLLGQLTDRLEPALRKPGPEGEAQKKEPAQELVPVAEKVHRIGMRIETMYRTISNVLGRLEI